MDFWDDYEHLNSEITYILENVKNEDSDSLIGCDCTSTCTKTPEICSCIQRSGAIYSFSDINMPQNYEIKELNPNKPIYECNNTCKCRNTFCGNRLVQFGPRKDLKIVSKLEKGLGLITTKPIFAGNFVCEYAGEIISQNQAKFRYEKYKETVIGNYIFCINEQFGERNVKTFIDPTFFGNIGRYINHSCDPNCKLVPIRIHDETPKLCIFSNTNLDVNCELTFDYGSNDCNNSERQCLCMSQKCRKFLPSCSGLA